MEVDDNFDVEKEFEKVVKEPRGVKEGDLWQLGEHKLMVGEIWQCKSFANAIELELIRRGFYNGTTS